MIFIAGNGILPLLNLSEWSMQSIDLYCENTLMQVRSSAERVERITEQIHYGQWRLGPVMELFRPSGVFLWSLPQQS